MPEKDPFEKFFERRGNISDSLVVVLVMMMVVLVLLLLMMSMMTVHQEV
jgi:predicted PurR-regulated permease PerM